MTEKKKTVLERWAEWISGRTKNRPSNEVSYGKDMDKVTMRLPKSVEEQLKLVNLMQVMEQFPNDYKVKLEFFRMVAPYGTTLNQQVTLDILGYAGAEVYISMYCDLLLRPLSQGAASKLEETIMEMLPEMTESAK